MLVEQLPALDWSPEQVAGWLRPHGLLRISHETIYLHVWRDKRRRRRAVAAPAPGDARSAASATAPTTAAADSQVNATSPSGRPRSRPGREIGHWEIDTVMGAEHGRNSVVTLVERATGYTRDGQARAALRRRCRRAAASSSSSATPGRVAHDHRRQRHRVPQLRRDRGGHRRRRSTSRPRTTPGSAAPTRTPTG